MTDKTPTPGTDGRPEPQTDETPMPSPSEQTRPAEKSAEIETAAAPAPTPTDAAEAPDQTAKTKSAKKQQQNASAPLVLSPKEPLETAREFIKNRYTVKGARTLQRYRGQLYAWDKACYLEMSDDALRKEVYEFLDRAVIAGTGSPKSPPQRFHPTSNNGQRRFGQRNEQRRNRQG